MNIKRFKPLAILVIFTTMITFGTCAVYGAPASTTDANNVTERTMGNTIDDQNLARSVSNVLDEQIPDGSFIIVSYGSKILLAGHVLRSTDIPKAINGAKNTQGVSSVWNYLTVGKKETAADISNDSYLTVAAKTRLIAQKNVNTNNIKVVTSNKIVYLLGSNAGNPNEIKEAIEGIKQIAGVKNVINLIDK